MSWIGRDFVDARFSYIAGKFFLNLSYAIFNIFQSALGEHFDAAVRQIADESSEPMAISHPVSCEAKAHTLNTTDKNYMPCKHFPSINQQQTSIATC
jgi:hypothetical protein